MTTTVASAEPRRSARAFIAITVLIDVLSFGVVIPVLPDLIRGFTGGNYAQAAQWIGWFGFLFAVTQFVCSPIQGSLSDRYGRRLVILLSCFGLGVDFLLMAVAGSLPWLLLARLISGMFSASLATANAYIADVVAPEQRARAFGMMGAAFGVGFIAGPLIGGWLGAHELRWPFWCAAGLALLNFLYGLLVLPESLPPQRRSRRIDWRQANPLGALQLLRGLPQVFSLAAVVFLANLAQYVYPSIFVLFAGYRYGWGPTEVAQVLTLVGVCSIIVNVVLVGRIVRRIGERRALLLGLGFGVLGFVILGFANSGWIFLLGVPVGALWGIAGPAAQALISREVGPDMQGRVQGALSSLGSLAGIIGSLLYANVFSWFIGNHARLQLPGAPWLLAGVLLALGWWLAWRRADRRAS